MVLVFLVVDTKPNLMKHQFVTLVVLTIFGCIDPGTQLVAATPKLLHEEVVTKFSAANNGATPMWCYSAPLIVRDGEDVFVSIIETGEDVPPLCNTRWQLWKREESGWRVVLTERDYRQREPCPLAKLPGGELFLSANPSLTKPGTRYRACKPTVFRIQDAGKQMLAVTEEPRWSEVANFNDHSYRGFAADGARGELLLLNIDTKTSEQFVSFRDRRGAWQSRGKIVFPIRAAYPQVALRDRAAHVMAIGDIREPNKEWEEFKREVTKRKWDYVFRRLFYCYTSDILRAGFSKPIEIDSVEETAGHILNLDLHIDQDGAAHVLYLKKPQQHKFMRDRYFPREEMTSHLEYVVIRDGRVESRNTLAETPKKNVGYEPSYARFHVAPEGKLSVVIAGKWKETDKPDRDANVIVGIKPLEAARELPLEHPFRSFFIASPTGGCRPSTRIDLFGTADDIPNLRYASFEMQE